MYYILIIRLQLYPSLLCVPPGYLIYSYKMFEVYVNAGLEVNVHVKKIKLQNKMIKIKLSTKL